MLGLQLKLTPAQVRVLMLRYKQEAANRPGMPLELLNYPFQITTDAALARRGLLTNDHPHKLSDEGRAIARLVYQAAKAIVDLYEGAEVEWYPATRMAEVKDDV